MAEATRRLGGSRANAAVEAVDLRRGAPAGGASSGPASAHAGAEVKLDKDFINGIVIQAPADLFREGGQISRHGSLVSAHRDRPSHPPVS